MNKDVIYIEPEDDITDIIAKMKSAKQKVVALVPPKKLGVLTSAINIKLIAKSAKTANKAAVIVTDNPSLMKLCASVDLPVAASLQSRPAVPSPEDIAEAENNKANLSIEEEAEAAAAAAEKEEMTEDFVAEPESAADMLEREEEGYKKIKLGKDEAEEIDGEEIEDALAADEARKIEEEKEVKPAKATKKKSAEKGAKVPHDEEETIELNDEDEEKDEKKEKKLKVPDLKSKRKVIIAGVIGVVALTILFVWAFAIAPAADITVKVGTKSNNFSENVNFTTNQADENAEEGKFYLEALTYNETLSTELNATGEEDRGTKASGAVTVTATFKSNSASVTIPAGSTFTQGGKKYASTKAVTLTPPGSCTVSDLSAGKCSASASVNVEATAVGDGYNCNAGASWTVNVSGVSASNSAAIGGGSSKIVKVVKQADVDNAVASLATLSEAEAKEILKEKMSKGYVTLDASYKAVVGDAKPSVAVGSEMTDKGQVSVEVTYNIYAVDEVRIEEFIRKKASIAEDQKIYELGDPYIERFSDNENGITGKLKTTYKVGPEVSNEKILEKVKGRKVGEAQSLLKSINGVNSVNIKTSFFWVSSIPNDPNKINVNVEVEE